MQTIKKNRQHSVRKTVIIAAVLIALILGYTTIAFAAKLWPFNAAVPPQTNTPSQPTSSSDSTDNPTTSTNNSNNTIDTVKNDTPDTELPASGSVTITAANQNGNILQVRTLIPGVHSTGSCTLTLTKGSSTVSVTSGIQPGPSTSTCQGFDVSISDQKLSSGEWTLTVDVTSDSVQASASQKVTIQ